MGDGDMKKGSGTVKFFNDTKGYGFILLDDQETEIFVHQTKIDMDGHRVIYENQPVQVEYYKETKGWKADRVTPDLAWAKENAPSGGRREYGNDRGGGGGGYHGGSGGYSGGGRSGYSSGGGGGYSRGYNGGGGGGGGYSRGYDGGRY